MVVVDTSIWIGHFRKPDPLLAEVLENGALKMHELVIAELALGSVPDRDNLLEDLSLLPKLFAVEANELIEFVSDRRLYSSGIGYVDAQLLIAAAKADGRLWTHDKRLAAQAERLGLAWASA